MDKSEFVILPSFDLLVKNSKKRFKPYIIFYNIQDENALKIRRVKKSHFLKQIKLDSPLVFIKNVFSLNLSTYLNFFLKGDLFLNKYTHFKKKFIAYYGYFFDVQLFKWGKTPFIKLSQNLNDSKELVFPFYLKSSVPIFSFERELQKNKKQIKHVRDDLESIRWNFSKNEKIFYKEINPLSFIDYALYKKKNIKNKEKIEKFLYSYYLNSIKFANIKKDEKLMNLISESLLKVSLFLKNEKIFSKKLEEKLTSLQRKIKNGL